MVALVAGQARTLKAALEHRIGVKVPLDEMDTVLAGGVRCVSDEQMRYRQRRKDADTQTAWTKGQHTDSGIWSEMSVVHALPNQQEQESGTSRFYPGVFVGLLKSSSEAVVVTEQGSAIETRAANVRRIPEFGKMGRGSITRNASGPAVLRRH